MIKFIRSVQNGVHGLWYVARSEANMRWHVVAALGVTAAGLFFRISLVEWALVVGCIGAMFALECVNTSIERLADRVTTEHDLFIKQAKDAAAAAVLVMSIATAIIGLIVFGPKLWAWWE